MLINKYAKKFITGEKSKKNEKKYAKKRERALEINFTEYPMTGNRRKELKLFRNLAKSMDNGSKKKRSRSKKRSRRRI